MTTLTVIEEIKLMEDDEPRPTAASTCCYQTMTTKFYSAPSGKLKPAKNEKIQKYTSLHSALKIIAFYFSDGRK